MAASRPASTASSCCCAGEENLREVVLFPMNQRAEDLMMGAPSEATPKQLRELHIRLDLPKKTRQARASAGANGRCETAGQSWRRRLRSPPWHSSLALAPAAPAQATLKIFDAHLHYNQEPNPFYPLDKVLEIFRRNGVTGILATSRPNKGTHQLVDAKAPGLWVVPFIRPYRIRADIQTWFDDPAIFDLIQDEYKRGYYRGIGEFHIYGNSAAAPLGQEDRSTSRSTRDLYLHAHCDEEALLILFGHNPSAKIIWAHTGFSTPPARVRGTAARNIRR